MRVIFLSLSIIFSLSFSIKSSSLYSECHVVREFEFDGCTYYKEGNRTHPKLWEHCCLQHDLRFWAGGTKSQRIRADKNLKQCVRNTGARIDSIIMSIGVYLGGLSPIKLKGKQWGNAWADNVRKDKLVPEDISQLKASLQNQSFLSKLQIKQFIKSLENDEI